MAGRSAVSGSCFLIRLRGFKMQRLRNGTKSLSCKSHAGAQVIRYLVTCSRADNLLTVKWFPVVAGLFHGSDHESKRPRKFYPVQIPGDSEYFYQPLIAYNARYYRRDSRPAGHST